MLTSRSVNPLLLDFLFGKLLWINMHMYTTLGGLNPDLSYIALYYMSQTEIKTQMWTPRTMLNPQGLSHFNFKDRYQGISHF